VKTMPIIAAAVLAAAMLVIAPSSSVAAAPTSSVATATATPIAAVHPNHGLAAGSPVTVSASGLPAGTRVNVVQCDMPTSADASEGCSPSATPTTSAHGTLKIGLSVQDPAYLNLAFGDPAPIYCRADGCRFFVEWTDAAGFHSIATPKMFFNGSPATIAATPATGLADGQTVHVSGSAKGSSGHSVTIVEESCFDIIQGSGCNGAITLATLSLAANDTYAGSVTVARYLGDGEDCVGNDFGCELSVTVLNADGQPDDSFGVSRIGQPAASIEFAG
jgi:Neocarzinostatin family